MKWIIRLVILLSASMTLCSCTLLSPVAAGASNTYLVTTVPPVHVARHHRHANLFVALPLANTLYNTTDMMYSTSAYQIDRFANSSWAATPAQMLQPLMVQTMHDTHLFHAVGGTIGVGQFDYMLTSQIAKFQQDFYNGHSVFRLTLHVQIIRSTTNAIVASKDFVIVTPAPQSNPYGGVVAANRATAIFLQELARFCARKI